MFGGSLPFAWPFAAVALHFLDGFLNEYREAMRRAETLFALLEQDERFEVERLDGGTNLVKLHVTSTDLLRFRDHLAERDITVRVRDGATGSLWLCVNPSLNCREPDEVAATFVAALGET
jgi:threonine aldolase